jgi:hypothetical protein
MRRGARWKLPVRFIGSDPGRSVTLWLVCLLATLGLALAVGVADGRFRALENDSRLWFGDALVSRATGSNSVTPNAWLSGDELELIRNASTLQDVDAYERIAGTAFILVERRYVVVDFVAVAVDDPARTVETNRNASNLQAVLLGGDSADMVALNPAAILQVSARDATDGRNGRPRLLLRLESIRDLLGRPDAVNQVAAFLPDDSDASSFALAFDMTELLRDELRAVPWQEMVGAVRYSRAARQTRAASWLLALVAIIGIAGNTVIAAADRWTHVMTLRTYGLRIDSIRRVFVRESAILSASAAMVAVALAILGRVFFAWWTDTPMLTWIAIGGAIVPPMVTLAATRRPLRRPLSDLCRDAQ